MSSVDSFTQARILFERLGEKDPTKDDALSIAPALFDIYERLMRVRQVSPTSDVSDRLWRLMELVGLKNRSLRKPPAAGV